MIYLFALNFLKSNVYDQTIAYGREGTGMKRKEGARPGQARKGKERALILRFITWASQGILKIFQGTTQIIKCHTSPSIFAQISSYFHMLFHLNHMEFPICRFLLWLQVPQMSSQFPFL